MCEILPPWCYHRWCFVEYPSTHFSVHHSHILHMVDHIKHVAFYCWPSVFWTSLVAQMVKCLHTMWETRVRSLGGEDPLEKEMATHSSTLAWKIPWEEPGRLESMGSQRVRRDWETSLPLCFNFFIVSPPYSLLLPSQVLSSKTFLPYS